MQKYGVNELRKMFLDFFESKEHLERAARVFPQADRHAVGVGLCPAAAEAASIRARRSVSPLLGSSAPAKEVPGLPTAGRGRFVAEIRRVPCG